MKNCNFDEGFVLPLILEIMLVLTILLSSLLYFPGGVRRIVTRTFFKIQEIYYAESSILAYLQNLPKDYSPKLMEPQVDDFGPYQRICAGYKNASGKGLVCAFAVRAYENLYYAEWNDGMLGYRKNLRERILENENLKKVSGNKRILSSGQIPPLAVHDGDLRVHFDGNGGNANFYVEGALYMEGNISYDTLRVYAIGNVLIQGSVHVNFLELSCGDELEMAGEFSFRGMANARKKITARGKIFGLFPSMLVALGENATQINLMGKSRVSGLVYAPAGNVFLDVSEKNHDSVHVVMPAFFYGQNVVFERIVYE